MSVDLFAVEAFLSGRHIAVVGASDQPSNMGRTMVVALTERGYDVVAVHPTATTVADRPAYADLALVPGPIDGVLVMVPAGRAADVVREAAELGVRRVWLFQGVGKGAVDREAAIVARGADMTLVEGGCPLMFLSGTGWVHRLHRRLRRYPAAAITGPVRQLDPQPVPLPRPAVHGVVS